MRPEVLLMAAELLGLAIEHYREAVLPPSGAAPAGAPPVMAPVGAKTSKPSEAAQPAVVH